MLLIDRYLLRQLLGPTVLATAALAAVALLSQSLSALDLIVGQRQSALVFAKVTLLAMPQLVNMVLPIAVFVAALVSLNRLHTEQEIVVCFAGGMSRWRVIAPALRLATMITLVAMVMNFWVQPLAAREMRETLFEVRTDLASTLIREGEFTNPAPGLTVYAQSVDATGLIHNLFIHQEKDGGGATTYTAEEGRLEKRNGKPVLAMHRGSMQEFDKADVLNYLTFDDYPYDLSPFMRTDELIHFKPSDRYLHELLFPDLTQDWEKRNELKLLAEGHNRIASPLYNIALMALAFAAIIGGGFSRMGYGRRIAILSAVAVGFRILGFVVQAASEEAAWLNILQYVVPIVATYVGLRSVFREKVSRFIDMRLKPHRISRHGEAAA
ncbi:LPS export ABC transporter permease LptF [Phenylobacterium sp. Root77]|uniref:LPS export ABC transporter permease LptF n=1 Tax=unclassified Phenylobacterium TaxID=2640670 RepID=UPI0006F74F8B|nr:MULTISPECIES: LPS export ABC transporter permease LptF [unclassified Phenylobacterium]KQW71770.1 LPS export ABC transporter permease LptF [Phenylobacterium sp. Root1277]KQW94690.1 LPS export ABC transporter permease LptF [Phenylobacterium sp. Root1290]KRC44383.1 LPS export ABC transporter permease LptF [Phenylobacterium sp. Root77]